MNKSGEHHVLCVIDNLPLKTKQKPLPILFLPQSVSIVYVNIQYMLPVSFMPVVNFFLLIY